MDAFRITGGRPLEGAHRVGGAKNAALPLMTAALLTSEPVTLRDVPDLADIANMQRLLGELGCESSRDGDAVTLCASSGDASHARYDIVRTMRASIGALGPLLAARGEARLSMPGGCAIGERPVDIHLRGLRSLGARITLEEGDIVARAPEGGRLRGARVFLGGPNGPTVLGTANLLSAATLAEGRTIIEHAACEPEIVDLAALLTDMGARIRGAGTPRITIDGVERLGGAERRLIPDRIEAGTFMAAVAAAGGDVTLENCPLDALMAVADRLEQMGVDVTPLGGSDPMRMTCRVRREGPLQPAQITTQPHPGFPTDLQAQFVAALTLAEGNSVVTERIFPERFLHVAELSRMGAQMFRQGPTVVISGVRELVGAPTMASDLRASAGLVVAGLAARGETVVHRVYHIDRGYSRIEQSLAKLGADIERIDAEEARAERLSVAARSVQPAGV
jgi:UDP-N-acetylglucosamine 1-carboxyvinyltransferase